VKRRVAVFLSRETRRGEQEIRVECEVTPETQPYFSRSFGNWLPGDPAEVDVLSTVPEVVLTDAEWERITEMALEAAAEPDDEPDDDVRRESY
jgi:hypothetical protein